MSTFIVELSEIAHRILGDTRKKIMRGETAGQIEGYLRDCRETLLHATGAAQRQGPRQAVTAVADVARAIRHTQPNGEMLGTLAVLSTVGTYEPNDFRRFTMSANQRLRAEVRDHQRLGFCDIDDIKLGAELALSSLEPLVA